MKAWLTSPINCKTWVFHFFNWQSMVQRRKVRLGYGIFSLLLEGAFSPLCIHRICIPHSSSHYTLLPYLSSPTIFSLYKIGKRHHHILSSTISPTRLLGFSLVIVVGIWVEKARVSLYSKNNFKCKTLVLSFHLIQASMFNLYHCDCVIVSMLISG